MSNFADECKYRSLDIMDIFGKINIKKIAFIATFAAVFMGVSFSAVAKSTNEFTVVIDAGHGGKDHGAIDNNAREKDINLAVAKRLGELIEKKIKNTDVVFTRDNDSFVSLQGRADIANKAKGDLFISIHTNSVDAKNKNRTSVAGASVYTLGQHKEGANMDIARRENAVIELEDGYHQKYSGFDPKKDESYIIFEMAQKQNLAQSNRFAKMVQDNLVKIAGRKDRGVHQAGFWVLWSTSMPAVLVELDFICNPESAKFMTSKEGVNKMAEAIFEAVKVYEMNYRQSIRLASNDGNKKEDGQTLVASNRASKERKVKGKKNVNTPETSSASEATYQYSNEDMLEPGTIVGLSFNPTDDERDLSHKQLSETRNQKKARHAYDGRRRRSSESRQLSESRNVEGQIALRREFTGQVETVSATASETREETTIDNTSNKKKKSKKKVSTKKVADKKSAASSSSKGAAEDQTKLSKQEKKRLEKERKAQEAADRQIATYKERQLKEQKKREKENEKKNKNSKKISTDNKSDNSATISSKPSSVQKNKSNKSSRGISIEESTNAEHAANRKSLKSKSSN